MRRLADKQKIYAVRLTSVALTVLLVAAALFAAGPLADSLRKTSYPIKYSEEVEYWSKQYDVDQYLVYAIMRTESGFKPQSVSAVGARGLMQMTVETFDWLKPKIALKEDISADDLYKPAVSIRFGVYFLSLCLERYGDDIETAAAAYHSGWGTVDTLLQDTNNTADGIRLVRFPYDQMYNYVYKVRRCFENYVAFYAE